MQELFLLNFLKTILVLYIIYKVSKLIIRYWIKRQVAAQQEAQRNSVDETQAQNMRANQGKVNVKMGKASKSQKPSSDAGEFVDFEEVD